MKARHDFVSNSSSSSFIVIVHEGVKCQVPTANSTLYLPTRAGNCGFGWEFRKYTSLVDKLNFAAIQLISLRCLEMNAKLGTENRVYCKNLGQFGKLYAMLKEVCSKDLGIDVELDNEHLKCDFNGYHYYDYGYYIDHQSSVIESSCMEMFESYVSLRDFLMYNGSMVVGGNDNADPPEGFEPPE